MFLDNEFTVEIYLENYNLVLVSEKRNLRIKILNKKAYIKCISDFKNV